jgi:crotonobetainyl-CoA:carnitine CoA-transferase CaiB-like acyl-CoA transferase
MLEAMGEWMGYPMYYAFDGAPPPPRTGASHASIYPYGPFTAGDGGTVMLGLQNEREWKTFCDAVLQRPEVATDARFASNAQRNQHRAELQALILEVFAALTAAQVIERLDAAAIANARVNDMAALWAHPQLAGAPALAQRGHARGRGAGAAAAGRKQRLRLPHGCGARRGPAHRRHPGRAGLGRGAHCCIAGCWDDSGRH